MSSTEEFKANLRKELEDLVRLRDELKVQAHLGAAEAREEWARLEGKLGQLQEEFGRIGEHAKPSLEELRKGAEGLAQELRAGFARIKEQFKS